MGKMKDILIEQMEEGLGDESNMAEHMVVARECFEYGLSRDSLVFGSFFSQEDATGYLIATSISLNTLGGKLLLVGAGEVWVRLMGRVFLLSSGTPDILGLEGVNMHITVESFYDSLNGQTKIV